MFNFIETYDKLLKEINTVCNSSPMDTNKLNHLMSKKAILNKAKAKALIILEEAIKEIE